MKSISLQHYLDNSGGCPRCGSDNIDADGFDVDLFDGVIIRNAKGITSQNCWCVKCGMSWTDEYTLSGVRSVYDLEKDEEWEVTA